MRARRARSATSAPAPAGPLRTCTGCRRVCPQRDLVRVAVSVGEGGSGAQVALDPARRQPGRGAYVHPRAACITAAGLSRALRRAVTPPDVLRIVNHLRDLSPQRDNSPIHDEDRDDLGKNGPGLAGAITVETAPRIKAKDDRSEDARV